ncbi:MAG: cell division protein ZapA [Sediminibacterium sp. Gen4]|jgi:cell division protein ZapA (FtsZ GTPase activity inhibitor)|uniref:cell division protein ZapA n=1 Tax=unclassified Sediminibacterium TaxID=2635961 RepID=UPI0015BB027E|nr:MULTISPECIES: cell division protein ZapA [unclassified Sediminibacterium]MBW0160790.1 cell division protein ZapA [Sediminibacterium sp.]MBW0165617.1 cell division protein ZapA [Sediminibacterium sp.]NWK64948.1 cell division protein ZapA [Sediminibacterium sp. Gen4]
MSELIPVNIVIADRNYRLRIEPKDEEMVRKTAGLINDKITEFKTNLAGKDMQDYVSMVLLWFATEQNQSGIELVKWEEASQKLATLERQLDKALEEL